MSSHFDRLAGNGDAIGKLDGPVTPVQQARCNAAAASSARLLTTHSSMGSSSVLFTFQPTFTQGLILGQCSILALLFVVLKYLFLDTEHSQKVPVYADPAAPILKHPNLSAHVGENSARVDSESTVWLNALLHQVCACLSPCFCARSPAYRNTTF